VEEREKVEHFERALAVRNGRTLMLEEARELDGRLYSLVRRTATGPQSGVDIEFRSCRSPSSTA
jgi:hypothetical protein